MFDFVRKHTKVLQFVLFLLVFPSFVLFGVEGYTRYNDKGEAVAKVDGRDIYQTEWDNAHKAEVDRLRQSMPTLDVRLLESPEAKYATLERLVRNRVLAAAAEKSKLVTSDARVARELQQNQIIAALRGPDGRLDMERYRQLAAQQGLTPEGLENQIRVDLASRQVVGGVAGSAIAAQSQASVAMGALLERREVQVARFNAADFAAKVNPTDAEIESYYKANPQLFQAPEQASIEYLVLDAEGLKKGITVNEVDLKTYYDQNLARLSAQEERRASHILIAAAQGAPAAQRQQAKARAEELLAQVKKAPETFAEVARKNSQDPGSAAKGGDLDFFARGAMVKPFEEVAFSLKPGEISSLVETEFGYHIIRVTDVKLPKQRSFEEMRPELEAELKKQQAQRKFAESADAFTNAVYEQSDGLKGVASRFGLELRTAQGVTRTPAPGATGPLANTKFLTALFSPDSVEKKRNTDAVEVASGQLVSGRLVEYAAARTLPLAEVKDKVRDRLKTERGTEQAKKQGADQLAAWKANPAAATGLGETLVIARDSLKNLPTALVEAALRADASALPAFAGVDLGKDGYAVVKVNKSLPRETPTDEALRQDRDQYAQWWGSAEGMAYYNMLKERFKVQIKAPKPAPRAEDSARTQ